MGVTVKELSEGILAVCIGGKERLERDLHLIREGSLKEVGEDLALAELFMMRVSLAAYFVQQFLRANVQEEARQAFNHKLQAALTNSGDARLMSQPNKAIDEFNKRYGAYMRAIETPHHLGLPWNVGKVFAKLCRP